MHTQNAYLLTLTSEQNIADKQNERISTLDSIVLKYSESLIAFACHIIGDRQAAEDIVQDVFVDLWTKRKKIDYDNLSSGYLYIATRNLAYNYLRSAKRHNERLKHIPLQDDTTILGYMVQEDAVRLLLEAIRKLPPRTSEVIMLSLDGLRQDEIAQKMNVSTANVKRLRALAIEKLKKSLGSLYSLISFL